VLFTESGNDDEEARILDQARVGYGAVSRRSRFLVLAGVLIALAIASVLLFYKPFPPDHTPEGAYARIAKAVAENHPRDAFAYLEQDAQDAAFSIRDMRKAAYDVVNRTYPGGTEKEGLLGAYRAEAEAPDGVDVFMLLDAHHGFLGRLRKDLSGVAGVETVSDRSTVVTARGTRYSFRRRPNGMWGLTLFSAEMLADSERAARDLASVRAAAADYTRAKMP